MCRHVVFKVENVALQALANRHEDGSVQIKVQSFLDPHPSNGYSDVLVCYQLKQVL